MSNKNVPPEFPAEVIFKAKVKLVQESDTKKYPSQAEVKARLGFSEEPVHVRWTVYDSSRLFGNSPDRLKYSRKYNPSRRLHLLDDADRGDSDDLPPAS